MIWDPLTKKLARIAFGGAVFVTGFGFYTKRKLKGRYEELEFYKDAVALLTSNTHIKKYLGEPIRIVGVDLTDSDTKVDDDRCKLAVRAVGTISRGVMYLEAVKGDGNGVAVLKSVEFELDKPKGRIRLR